MQMQTSADRLVVVRMPARFERAAKTWLAEFDLPATERDVDVLFQRMIDGLFAGTQHDDDPPCCDPGGGMRSPD